MSPSCRANVLKHVMIAVKNVDSWTTHTGAIEHIKVPLYIISGDLNIEEKYCLLMVGGHTDAQIQKVCQPERKERREKW